jgi:hypothetical protein
VSHAKSVHIRHFNDLGLAKLVCESPSFARTFANQRCDIRLRHGDPKETFIARFGGRSAAIRLMLLFCSSQLHRPSIISAGSISAGRPFLYRAGWSPKP